MLTRKHMAQIIRETVVKANHNSRPVISIKNSSPRDDLPALVVALAPLPEDNSGAVTDTTMGLVPMKCIKVEVDIVHHANAPEVIPHIPALSPQHR